MPIDPFEMTLREKIMYSYSKTAQKVVTPALLVALLNIVLSLAKSQGVELDANSVWAVAGGLYSIGIGIRNWLKNRKKG